jgi:peptidoglycan/LPS O-acetylase OafA/YrhL
VSTSSQEVAAPPGREFDIDSFRGFVCLCLVLLHFYTGNLNEYWQRLGGHCLEYAVWNLRFGVESFFILAGFMMAHMLRPAPGEAVSLTLYLKRRFYRLIIPYWVAVLLATADRWLVWTVLKRGGDRLPDIWAVLAQLTLLQEVWNINEAALGLWSMVTLEQFYLIWLAFYALVRLLIRLGRVGPTGYGHPERVMAGLTFLACAGSAAALMVGYNYRWQLPLFAIYLTLGMLLYWALRQRFARPLFLAAVGLLAAVAIVTETSRPVTGLLTVAFLAPLARGYRLPKSVILRGLAYVGQRSYSVYLVHGIVGQRVFSLASKLGGRDDWVAFPLLAAGLIATLLAAMLFYRYVELPCREKARSVKFRRSANPP